MSNKTMQVAWREFKTTVLTKAFIIGAIFVPALFIALGVLGMDMFNPTPSPLDGRLAIIDPAGDFESAARIEFEPERMAQRLKETAREIGGKAKLTKAPDGDDRLQVTGGDAAEEFVEQAFKFRIELEFHPDPAAIDGLKERLRAGELIGIASTDIPPEYQRDEPATDASKTADVDKLEVVLYVPSNMNIKHTDLLEDTIRYSAGRANIDKTGLDVELVRELSRASKPKTVRLSETGVETEENKGIKAFKMLVPMAFMLLLWMGSFVSANYLLTTTIEEKSNKVMEVLLSAVSPMQLMAGKIIGQAFVGLVMTGLYAGLAVTGLVVMAFAHLLDWIDLVYLGLYFIMAYFMIASIYAAIGSAVNELREAQSLMTPAMIVIMIPLFLWLPISDSPNGMLGTVTSFIPPLIPFVMILRVTGSEPIPFWQIPASLGVGYLSMFGMIWMAAKIFRVGVLMYGKPPSPIELIKWMRYS